MEKRIKNKIFLTIIIIIIFEIILFWLYYDSQKILPMNSNCYYIGKITLSWFLILLISTPFLCYCIYKYNKNKKIIITTIILVGIILILSIFVIPKYDDCEYIDCTPSIHFLEKDNTIYITYTEPNLNWKDIRIYGNGTPPTGLINEGDTITDCLGEIIIYWEPTNSVLAQYDFE